MWNAFWDCAALLNHLGTCYISMYCYQPLHVDGADADVLPKSPDHMWHVYGAPSAEITTCDIGDSLPGALTLEQGLSFPWIKFCAAAEAPGATKCSSERALIWGCCLVRKVLPVLLRAAPAAGCNYALQLQRKLLAVGSVQCLAADPLLLRTQWRWREWKQWHRAEGRAKA